MIIVNVLKKAKTASYQVGQLREPIKNKLLSEFANLVQKNGSQILQENLKDQKLSKGKISEALFNRLKLNSEKIEQLVHGIHEVEKLKDPSHQTLFRRELDDGLILEKQTVPLGVLAIIFEARPDAV